MARQSAAVSPTRCSSAEESFERLNIVAWGVKCKLCERRATLLQACICTSEEKCLDAQQVTPRRGCSKRQATRQAVPVRRGAGSQQGQKARKVTLSSG